MKEQNLIEHCEYFGECGGCFSQISQILQYSKEKADNIKFLFQQAGIKATISDIIICDLYSRRRIELLAKKDHIGLKLGFSKFQQHDIVDIEKCYIAVPEISKNLAEIKALAKIVSAYNAEFRIHILACATGLDISFKNVSNVTLKLKEALIARAMLYKDIIRVNIGNEILVEKTRPYIYFEKIAVTIPPAGFVQAVEKMEKIMVGFVLSHLAKCKNIIDLFCGSGTFSFPCLYKANVTSVEYDKAALQALQRAYNANSQNLKQLKIWHKDLFNFPVSAKELKKFDGLIFNPPRAGALNMAIEIAKSNIEKVVAISCNINSLIEDLKILLKGGYVIEKIIPIDQFLLSPHCEIVVLLNKKRQKPSWSL